MRTARAPRWAISFADLALLLLGCFVMLLGMQTRPTVSSPPAPEALPGTRFAADGLFEAGEARLSEEGRARLAEIAASAAGARIEIVSEGQGSSSSRFDAFELAAARAAAVARLMRGGGISERDVSVSMLPAPAASREQHLTVRIVR